MIETAGQANRRLSPPDVWDGNVNNTTSAQYNRPRPLQALFRVLELCPRVLAIVAQQLLYDESTRAMSNEEIVAEIPEACLQYGPEIAGCSDKTGSLPRLCRIFVREHVDIENALLKDILSQCPPCP